MKRTIAQIIRSSLFQFHKRTDDFNDVEAWKNLLYGVLCDHEGSNITEVEKLERLIMYLHYFFLFKKQMKSISSLGDNLKKTADKK